MSAELEGEERFDGLLLRLAGEHTDGGISEVNHVTYI